MSGDPHPAAAPRARAYRAPAATAHLVMLTSALSLAAFAFCAPSHRVATSSSVPMRRLSGAVAMATSGLLTGERVPTAVLSALGIEGQLAVVAFYCRDDGFEDKKELADFQGRAPSYQAKNCAMVAVRSDAMQAVLEGTEALYPSLRFVVDEGNAIRKAMRMSTSGLRNGDRHTYLIDAEGRVQGQVINFADPFIHSAMAIRTLKALDDGYSAASEKIDQEAAAFQALWDKEEAERIEREAAFAEKAAERDAALERGERPEPAANFFEGFFGAFNKKS